MWVVPHTLLNNLALLSTWLKECKRLSKIHYIEYFTLWQVTTLAKLLGWNVFQKLYKQKTDAAKGNHSVKLVIDITHFFKRTFTGIFCSLVLLK